MSTILPQEVIDRSIVPPDHCVMYRYPNGLFGWRFDPELRRTLDALSAANQKDVAEMATKGANP
jgi:hypothetical protein